MSDFRNPGKTRTARKEHQCHYCAEMIMVGEKYIYQTGVYDYIWYSIKMHPECFDSLPAGGEDEEEYTPYGNERPHHVVFERREER